MQTERDGSTATPDQRRHAPVSSRRAVIMSTLLATAFFVAERPSYADSDQARVFALKETADPARPFLASATREDALLDKLAKNDVIFLGEHHNKADDHNLQAEIIAGLSARRGSNNMAVGLEMVQVQYQPALDAYIAAENKDDAAAEKALYDGVQWAERWQWSFEAYLPVFRLARTRKIPLVALNVDSASMEKVRFGGFENLPQEARDRYVDDKKGFIQFAKTPGFVEYVERVVMPSYEFHARMGLLGSNPSQANFYSSRILWDEGMSNVARRFVEKYQSSKMIVVLEGADHVKFDMGSVGRMKRMAPKLQVASVLLNPTPVDSLGPASDVAGALALQMSYGGQVVKSSSGQEASKPKGALKVADYLWFSAPPGSSLLPAALRSVA